MDLAFPTVILFLILLPGFVARRSYFTFPFDNKVRSTEFVVETFWSIIPGLFLHFIYVFIWELLTGRPIVFEDIFFLIAGKDDNSQLSKIAQNVHVGTLEILLYLLGLIVFAAGLGYLLKFLVRRLRLDRRFETLRFGNKWYYILSGELLDMDALESTDSQGVKIVMVDILCNVGGRNILYVGELVNYYLTRDRGLESVLLRYPRRRYLEDDDREDRYYDIPSDLLHIANRDIINLNVRYFQPLWRPEEEVEESS